MTMTAREAFEKGTATFNAHDLDGFAQVLANDVVFKAPGGINGEGKAACTAFFGSWFAAFPDARVEVQAVHIVDDIAVEEGTFTGPKTAFSAVPWGTSHRRAAPSKWTISTCSAFATASMFRSI